MNDRPRDPTRIQGLMMASCDGELSPEGERELAEVMREDEALQHEWARLQKLKEMTTMMQLKTPPDHMWNTYWGGVYNRLERSTAWVLVSIGVVVLMGWGLWEAVNEILADTATPLFVKLAVFSVGLGGAILLISVIREKIFLRRRDPFREVER